MNTMLLRQAPPVFCFRCGGRHFLEHPDGWQCDFTRNGCGQVYYNNTVPKFRHSFARHMGRRRN